MATPVILIPVGSFSHVQPPSDEPEAFIGCEAAYAEAVALAGGTPLLAPGLLKEDAGADALDRADGLLLAGGGDFHPQLYGADVDAQTRQPDTDRDALEIALVWHAMRRNMPVLGICRGMQVINLARGGALLPHLDEGTHDAVQHTVHIEPETQLRRLANAASARVNSWHHQAVDRLGNGLCVNARAEDGIVEGLESSEALPVLAVQWHPEEDMPLQPLAMALFRCLISEAETYRARQHDAACHGHSDPE
jgi:gamma-glutamyl-gamma-aminobutyrate hydrolase PuuD